MRQEHHYWFWGMVWECFQGWAELWAIPTSQFLAAWINPLKLSILIINFNDQHCWFATALLAKGGASKATFLEWIKKSMCCFK